jgi:hypothetical protein
VARGRQKVAVKQEVRRLSGTSNKAKKPLLEEEAEKNVRKQLEENSGLLENGEHDAVLASTNDYVYGTISVFTSSLCTRPDRTVQRKLIPVLDREEI